MKIIDTTEKMFASFDGMHFDLEKWGTYMDAAIPHAKQLCLDDLRSSAEDGCSWENDCLPVLNAVITDREKAEKAIQSFHAVTDGLAERIERRFGRGVDVDIILYLGLCSGAGWVTTINGRRTILLGIEKIAELDWCDENSMTGLIVHELGHVYQAQYGRLCCETKSAKERFLWQLFTEGVAMVFEQEITGNPGYYHQDRGGWKEWCDRNFERIRDAFSADAETMTDRNQRYFGDWVQFEGHPDTGYYLGARFVRFLTEHDTFDSIIGYGTEAVAGGFERFCGGSA
ncbi:MAG: hypothetical protein K6B39_04090 [Lachnospiraceae bacterium]|nr:hypothetical protein [Lachnospiraceae bacterium]